MEEVGKEVMVEQKDKDAMTEGLIKGLLPKEVGGIIEKLPTLLENLSPQAYDGLAKILDNGNINYMLSYDPEYGIIIQKLYMNVETTKIDFADPTKEDVIIVQKGENGVDVIKDGVKSNIGELIKGFMSSVGSKLF